MCYFGPLAAQLTLTSPTIVPGLVRSVGAAWVSASWASLAGMVGAVGHGCLLACFFFRESSTCSSHEIVRIDSVTLSMKN
jgi:hypothetical protein